jgi:hypothetical protein
VVLRDLLAVAVAGAGVAVGFAAEAMAPGAVEEPLLDPTDLLPLVDAVVAAGFGVAADLAAVLGADAPL